MPKEVIHDDRVNPGEDNSTPLAVTVQWGRDAFVQVASVNLQAEPTDKEHGWFVDVDRRMVNQLIRVLRRARDQAYGVDE